MSGCSEISCGVDLRTVQIRAVKHAGTVVTDSLAKRSFVLLVVLFVVLVVMYCLTAK